MEEDQLSKKQKSSLVQNHLYGRSSSFKAKSNIDLFLLRQSEQTLKELKHAFDHEKSFVVKLRDNNRELYTSRMATKVRAWLIKKINEKKKSYQFNTTLLYNVLKEIHNDDKCISQRYQKSAKLNRTKID